MKETLELQAAAEIQNVREKGQKLEEKRRQKRKIEGAIFLEIILQKIWEYEQGELFDGTISRQMALLEADRTQENKTAQKSDEDCLCFWEEGRLWERMVPTGDILEISIPRLRQAVEESYDELMHMIAVVQQICENPCYAVSSGILERFYNGECTEGEVVEGFRDYCLRRHEQGEADFVLAYEYFSHANAWWAVKANNKEGETLVERCGLKWTGTSYYNAFYYYKWKNMQQKIEDVAEKVAEFLGYEPLKCQEIRVKSRFLCGGGLDFHGVWQYEQRANNYPENQYGLLREEEEPPEHYAFLYRNFYDETDKERLRELLCAMKEKQEAVSCRLEAIGVKERAYHNGMSYLLHFCPQIGIGEVKKSTYEQAMKFTENFRLFRVHGCLECLFIAEQTSE